MKGKKIEVSSQVFLFTGSQISIESGAGSAISNLNRAHQSVEILLVATMDQGKRPLNLPSASMDGEKRPPNLPSASNSEDDLTKIIREQALPFLPAKSLFRFKAVCRKWKHHISTPSFHLNRSFRFTDITGLSCQPPKSPVFIPIHPTSAGVPGPSLSFLPEPVVIRASSNGLLCCQGRNEDDLIDIIRKQALPFLPAKSLFRFKAVCRKWKHHISTPSFHLNRSFRFTDITGLSCQPPKSPVFIPIHPTSAGVPGPSLSFLPEPVVIRASSNGLLFKAVCRKWKHHISTPSFHLNRSFHFTDITGLSCQPPKSPVFIPIHPTSAGVPGPSLSFLPEPVVIRASSNGLLCCQGRNEDDLIDIIRKQALPFLPAKSLFRFKAVCRKWKHHISTPSFHLNQSLRFTDITGLFCQPPQSPPVFIPIHPSSAGVPDPSLSFLPEPVVIRASSNGLLCCQGRNEDRDYYLCNPVTKQCKKLPKPTASHGSKPAFVVILEPSQLTNNVSEFKLVCAFEATGFDDAIGFEIYSSKNNSWDVSGDIFLGAKTATLGFGVHVNGVVYWPVKSGGIVSFDLTKDKSQLLDNVDPKRINCVLGTYYGRLCKVYILLRYTDVRVNVMVNIPLPHKLKMWELLCCAVYRRDTYMPLNTIASRVVAIGREEVVVKCGNQLYSYNFQSKETKTLIKPDESNYEICVPYVNSLVSLSACPLLTSCT
nr:F-box protein At5g07610-like [Ipomoea trifida]